MSFFNMRLAYWLNMSHVSDGSSKPYLPIGRDIYYVYQLILGANN
jgi:hypothetical protein